MSTESKQIIDNIIPYVKKIVLQKETAIKNDLATWLKAKGFFVGFIGTKLIPIAWDLITGPALPFIITLGFNTFCGICAPYLVPFLPILDRGLDFINDKYLSEFEKKQLLDIIHVIVSFKNTLPELEPAEKMQLLESQEHFASL